MDQKGRNRLQMDLKKERYNCISLFFTGSFHTWIFSKYYYATETEDYKNFLRMDSVIYYEI